ncbi:MEDS domain-containing protein [Streptacidiphilus carbonis]|uniref:MEDS domain-containing protein n=1 Tax=Streptacidiphilus carbonis TaxID=105422 RepID=UPI0005A734CF|nr:MEDS domain-containing protein [Streptacidiphilus carbonis]
MATVQQPPVPVGAVRPNDHLCFVFGDERERAAVTAAFVRDGVQWHDKVIYIAEDDGPALARVRETLSGAGIDVDGLTATGQLMIIPADLVYMIDGYFDIDRTVAMMDALIEQSGVEGYRLLRVTGETGWVPRHGITMAQIVAYEQAVSPLAVGGKVLALCQYDHRAFAAADMAEVDAAHNGRAAENAQFEDGELVILRRHGATPGLGLSGAVGDTGHSPLAQALKAALADGAETDQDLHVDMSGLDFIDLEGLRLLMATRQDLSDGRSLHLERPAAHVRRVIRMAGWDTLDSFRSTAPDFRHQVCVYGSDEEFLAMALPFVEEGFRLGEPVLAATTSANLELLTEALGEQADRLDFAETAYFGRRPPQRVAAFERYWRHSSAPDGGGTSRANGAARRRHVRIIAEPVWAGRSRAEAAAWKQMESQLNALLTDTDIWMICPYDSRIAGPDVLADALRTHPQRIDGTRISASDDYLEPVHFRAQSPAAAPLDPPPTRAARLCWSSPASGSARLRGFVADHAMKLGLERERAELLVLAVAEVARLLGHAAAEAEADAEAGIPDVPESPEARETPGEAPGTPEAPEPSGSTATVAIWSGARTVSVELTQPGPRPADSVLDDPTLGYRLPRPDGPRPGEGLWLARQICESVEVRASATGCTVRMELAGARAEELRQREAPFPS